MIRILASGRGNGRRQHGDPDQQSDRGYFGDRGDKCGRRIGGPLVDVGRPEMQREEGKLEEKPGHGECQGQNAYRLGNELRKRPDDVGKKGGTGHRVKVTHPEKHDARGYGAEEEILHRRLQLQLGLRLAQGDNGIEAEGRNFQTDHDGDQFHGAGQHHQTERGKRQKHEVVGQIAAVHLVFAAEHENHVSRNRWTRAP